MAKKIKQIHDLVGLLTTKGRTGYHSANDIDIAVYAASKELFNLYYKSFQANNDISDSLRPFIVGPVSISLTAGAYTIPDEFIHEIGQITAGTSDKSVDRIDHQSLAKRRNNSLVPPTEDYPICVFYATTIQFYPTTITNVKWTYLKKPIQPVYATTISSGREVYDDASSVDIEWNEIDVLKITERTLGFLGINLEDMKLVEYSELKQKTDA